MKYDIVRKMRQAVTVKSLSWQYLMLSIKNVFILTGKRQQQNA